MKKTAILLFIFLCAYSQDEISLDEGFTINVEPERPRVQMISTREKPEFPDVKISKVFFEEIIDRRKNYKYTIETRKLIAKIKIDKELNELK